MSYLYRLLFVVRLAGFGAIAAFAVVAVSELGDDTDPPTAPQLEAQPAASMSSELDEALSDARLNSVTADYAPQQQVVNGWAARDLLAVIGAQNDETNEQLAIVAANQVAAAQYPADADAVSNRYLETLVRLALLLVVAVCWQGLTARLRWAQQDPSLPTVSEAPRVAPPVPAAAQLAATSLSSNEGLRQTPPPLPPFGGPVPPLPPPISSSERDDEGRPDILGP